MLTTRSPQTPGNPISNALDRERRAGRARSPGARGEDHQPRQQADHDRIDEDFNNSVARLSNGMIGDRRACTIGAEPNPASFENSPRAMPKRTAWPTAAPANPPTAA